MVPLFFKLRGDYVIKGLTNKIKNALVDLLFLIASISLIGAFLSSALLRIEFFKKFMVLFRKLVPYMRQLELYGYLITASILVLVMIFKARKYILKAIKFILMLPFIIIKTRVRIAKKKKRDINLIKVQKKINMEEKAPYSMVVPLKILPDNKQYKETNRLGKKQYEDAVKRAFKRIGFMKDEEIGQVKVRDVKEGPQAIQITISIPDGITLSRIRNVSDDLMHAFLVPSLQITPARDGNINILLFRKTENRRFVVLKDVLKNPKVQAHIRKAKLPIIVGVSPVGEPIVIDLTKEPHLLIAGTTGSGKSVFNEQALVTLLMAKTPEELKLWLVDPKMVELDLFKEFPHVQRVETQSMASAKLLKELCMEMDRRYKFLAEKKCKNIDQFYSKYPKSKELPYIIILVDELADLMTVAQKEVEPYILRLAQKARAAGIHMMVATQRPSVDIVTGVIKANLPSRVVFALKTRADYATVFDNDPKTELLGMGDGLADIVKERGYLRFQSPCVGLSENDREKAIENIRQFWMDWINKNESYKKQESISLTKSNDTLVNNHQLKHLTRALNEYKKANEGEMVLKHGMSRLVQKVVPDSNFKGGTSVEIKKEIIFDSQKANDKTTDKNSNNIVKDYSEVDYDAYTRLQILKKILRTLENEKENELMFAPSTNELSKELEIRKATVIDHYKDLNKEGIIDKHPSRRYVIKSSIEEISEIINDLEKYFDFVAL